MLSALGADDDVVEPFRVMELLARIRTGLRHVTASYLYRPAGELLP